MHLPEQITSDNVFLLILTLSISVSLRVFATYFAFKNRTLESYDSYFYSIPLTVILLAHIHKIKNIFLRILLSLHVALTVALPVAHILVTLQCFLGYWSFHDIIFLPQIIGVFSIASVVTGISFLIGLSIYLYLQSKNVCPFLPQFFLRHFHLSVSLSSRLLPQLLLSALNSGTTNLLLLLFLLFLSTSMIPSSFHLVTIISL